MQVATSEPLEPLEFVCNLCYTMGHLCSQPTRAGWNHLGCSCLLLSPSSDASSSASISLHDGQRLSYSIAHPQPCYLDRPPLSLSFAKVLNRHTTTTTCGLGSRRSQSAPLILQRLGTSTWLVFAMQSAVEDARTQASGSVWLLFVATVAKFAVRTPKCTAASPIWSVRLLVGVRPPAARLVS